MSEIPYLLKKKEPTLTEMFELQKSNGMKKGEISIWFAKPATGKTKLTEQTLRDLLKEKQ